MNCENEGIVFCEFVFCICIWFCVEMWYLVMEYLVDVWGKVLVESWRVFCGIV